MKFKWIAALLVSTGLLASSAFAALSTYSLDQLKSMASSSMDVAKAGQDQKVGVSVQEIPPAFVYDGGLYVDTSRSKLDTELLQLANNFGLGLSVVPLEGLLKKILPRYSTVYFTSDGNRVSGSWSNGLLLGTPTPIPGSGGSVALPSALGDDFSLIQGEDGKYTLKVITN